MLGSSQSVGAELERQIQSQLEHQFLETIPPEGLDPELVKGLPLEFLKKQCAIPIRLENGEIVIALADPLNIEAYDAILSVLAQPCKRVVCPASEIEQAVSRCYYQSTGVENNGEKFVPEASPAGGSDVGGTGAQTQAEDLLSIANKAPVIKLVNKIFFQAMQSRASDIHVEPYENEARVRFRIDGVLHNVLTLPKQQTRALLSRLKIMSNLDIAERRLPQDGQSRIKTGQDLVDVRVSVIPTLGGERAVLRLLDKGGGELSLEQIGFGPDILERFRSIIRVPHGIILLTGPTGSGKTTTLYAALNELNSEERNILTVEDPIEYQLPGIGQMQVKPKINLTFANCLRHILRQDPDVIMIGEIRDLETAEIAIQASLTGHLVLSTLHTNDSASAVTRLLDMGIEPYLISSSVIAVMAQRLLRLICPSCKSTCQPQGQASSIPSTEFTLSAAEGLRAGLSEGERASVSQGQLYKGLGCDNCLKTGYFGRTGIFELLIVDDQIKELIIKRRGSHIIKETAIAKGMSSLREDGLRKVLAGQTALEEVCRVTQDVETNIGATKRVSS